MKNILKIAVRIAQYKLVWGQVKMMHRSAREAKKETGVIESHQQVFELFDLEKDPTE